MHGDVPGASDRRAAAVVAAYDRIAEAWHASRARDAGAGFRARPFVDGLVAPLAPRARILDVGCGGGVPIAAYLVARGLRVTGLDASSRMLELARAAVPAAEFLHGDMRTAALDDIFDALVAWDSVFHLPRDQHAAVFTRFRTWLRAGGRLLVSLGGSAEAGFTSEMFGETFFYSGHEPGTAVRLLGQAGFQVEHWQIDDPSSRGHMVVLASALHV
jgi:cyclopropane fatty-acyl-phospholipid synthase-like methyltransferase